MHWFCRQHKWVWEDTQMHYVVSHMFGTLAKERL